MSMYIPPEDQRPTEAEADEFIDAPEQGAAPELRHPVRNAGTASGEDSAAHDDHDPAS